MNDIADRRWREVLPTLGVFFAVAIPSFLLWRTPWGRGYALMVFFLGCTIAAAKFMQRALAGTDRHDLQAPWVRLLAPLAVALVVAAAIFSAICLAFGAGVEDPRVAPMLAFMSIVPVLGITPYLVLTLRRRFAAVVLTVALVGCMKFMGTTIVVLTYGWDADEQGRTRMPWDRPNLLVWLFWSFTAALSLTLFLLGARRYRGKSSWVAGGEARRELVPQT